MLSKSTVGSSSSSASASTSSTARPSGLIKTLKRSFSSNTPVLGPPAGNADAQQSSAKKQKKLKIPDSAYDFDLGDEDDDWGGDIDITITSTASVPTSVPARVTVPAAPKAASKGIPKTAATSSLKSPPRAPQPLVSKDNNKYTDDVASTFPPASQWQAGFTKPELPKSLPRAFAGTNSPLDQAAYEHAILQQPSLAPSTLRSADDPHKPLSAATMQAPFSKKGDRNSKNQNTLSQFVVRADASSSSSSSSLASYAGGGNVVADGKRRKLAPWDAAPEPLPSKAVKPSRTASADSASSKGKGRGTGIGPLNVKQQIVLSAEQQKVLKAVVDGGKNVFFTGSAGTGKSILLREIIASLRRKYASRGADRVAVTASTGMAAANIGGTTIHSFAGIGLGQGTPEQLVDFIKKSRKAPGRWLRTEVLIIDEVSMLDGDLFDKLAHIAQRFRRKPGKPFGGIQLIMTGDFFQLPPVTKNRAPVFAFEAKAWEQCIDMTVNLTKVFRQRDTEFIDMLNEMRFGLLSQDSITKFRKLKREPKYDDGIEPTELFPLRDQVESSNRLRLQALPGESHTFEAYDEGEEAGDRLQKTLENVMAPKVLTLKLNAQVMLLKNMDNGLVNGSVGKVVGFKSAEEPLDDADADLFASPEEEFNIKIRALKNDRMADEPVRKAKNVSSLEKAPVVQWTHPDGSKLLMRMVRDEFKVDDVGDKVKAKRKQFPMICAWAMSIHKSQGQTLERVKCDLGKIFEKGQAYVALSRATSLDGLQVLNFDHTRVLAHPKVVTWTKTLTVLDK